MNRVGIGVLAACLPLMAATAEPPRPNVLVIVADDLGFSDLGSYGGEIDTPNLDRLAAGGLRFTQGYNTARCWPTRAALLTGYYPQAVGRDALPGGNGGAHGRRPAWAKLLPERLAAAGYRSYHSGKWHIDGDPRAEGFARSLDVLDTGQSNFFDPGGVTEDGRPIAGGGDFYVTTAIGDHAVRCLDEHARDHDGTPFFHYVAFTSPHFPVQAPAEVVATYRKRYRAGWDAVRAARATRLRESGIVATAPAKPEPEVGPPYQPNEETLARIGPGEVDRPHPWDALTDQQREFQATKMAIHAAMVDVMDREVGRIIAQLEATAALDNTLVVFLSDNGASAEIMIRGEGHDPTAAPGSRKTFLCLGPGWSGAANTPFRRHKTWVHEGGIATPWIVHWPKGIAAKGELRRQPVHAIDLVPTVLELSRVPEPQGQSAPPLHGRSFAAALADAAAPPAHASLWWCHQGHRAVRMGDWKLVSVKAGPWELYDLATDRCETTNLAASQPDRVTSLERDWNRIAAECRGLAPVEKAPATVPKPAPAKAAGSAQPPNVVIVFADDLGYGDLGCSGGRAAATPAIDSLARDGMRFTDFHVAQAVCSASRAALLTGCYPNRIGIAGALGPAARHGFDESFGLPYSNDMWLHHQETKPGTFPPLPLVDGDSIVDADVTPKDQATLTARSTARAVRFIERAGSVADGRPFFRYLARTMPHVPLFAGEGFRGRSPGGLYGDVLAEIDASVAERARADLGDSLTKRKGAGVRPAGSLREAAAAVPDPVRLASFASRAATQPPRPLAGRRPNIIYVMTDDQGYGDLAAHGNPVIQTPNLDRLRDQSVRFTEFHVSPTCAPTRAALLTGRHEFRSGITHTILERERLALDAVTLPELLKPAGYTSGIFGKWHLGDEDDYQPGKRGFDRVFIHGAGGIGQSYPGSCGDAPGNTYVDPVIRSDGTFVRTKGYCTDVFFDAALDWIGRCRQADKPFFCYLTPNCPHAPYDCPPGSDEKYVGPLEAAGIEDPKQRATIARFDAMIENIDTNMGRLLAQLDAWGIAEETLVVFSTDNGTAAGGVVFNDGMRGTKCTPYRGGTRVPAFWRWPGTLPAGVDVAAVTAHVDVVPTLCELAGATIPPEIAVKVEGRSLVPLLADAEAAWPDRLLVTHVGRWERGKAAESAHRNCRIREGRWQLVNTKNKPDAWELFDLGADPGEQHDVAAGQPEVVARLGAAYDAWWASVQADLVNENLDGPKENPFKVAFRNQFGPAATAAPPAVKPAAEPARPARRRDKAAAVSPLPPTLADVRCGEHPKQVRHFRKAPGATAESPSPLVLLIHGGGWRNGDGMGGLPVSLE
ncbi:MAG: sulfatase-like hydrolase/transferase [Planctomycetota bacterium]